MAALGSASLRASMRRLGLVVNLPLVGLGLLAYLLLAGVWPLRDVLIVFGVAIAASPVLTAGVGTVLGVFNRPLHLVLEAGVGNVDAAQLDRARRVLFRYPRNSGLTSAVVNIGVLTPLLVGIMWVLEGTPRGWEVVALGGLAVGGTGSLIAGLWSNVIIRPYVALLFPSGGLAAYQRAYRLSIRSRLILTTQYVGPVALLLVGGITLRRVAATWGTGPAFGHLAALVGYFVAFFAVVAAVLGRQLGVAIDHPLQALVKAQDRVGQGDFTVRVPLEANDELGLVANSFNAMVQGLAERARLQDAFGRYVSPEVAQHAITGDLVLGGETRDVAVLFSDIRSFTTLSEGLDPQTLVGLLNRYFAVMVEAIRAEGGSVNKFLGDGIMALFGAPAPLADPAGAAVRAAIAMQRVLATFNDRQRREGAPQLAFGVGIAFGPVVVGNVGSPDRMEYTAIGDTVNTASRIEGLTKEFGTPILVDEATAGRLGGLVPLVAHGSTAVKGRQQPVRVFAPAPVGSGHDRDRSGAGQP